MPDVRIRIKPLETGGYTWHIRWPNGGGIVSWSSTWKKAAAEIRQELVSAHPVVGLEGKHERG